jgi:hypothetical protein
MTDLNFPHLMLEEAGGMINKIFMLIPPWIAGFDL